MSEWPLIELDELAADEPNSFVDGPFGSDMKTSDYVDAGVPLIRIQNVRPNQFLSKEIRYISEAKARQLARHQYRPGDLVITKLGEPCGVACLVPESAGSGVIVADIVRFRGDKQRVDHRYLSHFINSPTAASWVAREAKGTTRQRVNLSNFRRLPVPLPPLPEQRRIAQILDKADALRAKRRAALAQLDTLTQSIFLDMFGDPATNPKGWPMRTLANILAKKPNNGVFRKNDEYSTNGDGLPVVWVQELFRGDRIDTTQSRRLVATNEEIQRFGLKTGDLLFCRSSVKYDGIAFNNVYLGRDDGALFECHLIRVTPNSLLANSVFLNSLFRTPAMRAIAKSRSKTATMTTIDQESLASIELPVPPISSQREFADRIESTVRARAAYSATVVEHDALFRSLQHRAFRGEL